jgi:geranylgeranyl pyrophosphate synthase
MNQAINNLDINMSLFELMPRCEQRVQHLLRSYLPHNRHDSNSDTQAMNYACLNGGKRLRPLLAYIVADIFEFDWEAIDPLATAIEMIHCYSLVHDDLPAMDNDDLRRGLPTCHKRYGEATAILSGDALLTLAFEILSHEESFCDKNIQCKIINHIAKKAGTNGMVKGQILDLSKDQKYFNLDQLIEMHRAKTGALIEAVVQCAAWICSASTEQQSYLAEFSKNLGLAFQIQDDLLDAIGDSKKMGKHSGQDAKNQTCTFVTLLGIDKTKLYAKQTIDKALKSIEPFGKKATHLNELALYIIKRTA